MAMDFRIPLNEITFIDPITCDVISFHLAAMPLQSPLCYSANRQKINQFHSLKWNPYICLHPHLISTPF